ncbi:MAG TPA: hypothetical protein VNB90_12560 [Cytophagaceae bacterium]|jgi:hypothetical protein|nr:hypothetical protein [Cytophagaceae bacterium]
MKTKIFAVLLCLAISSSLCAQTSTRMKEYSFIVRVPVTYSREQVAAANEQWKQLMMQWKKDSIYITSFPFPGESYVVVGKDKLVKKETIVSEDRIVVSAIFLRAENFEKALELAKTFPVLIYDGSVEVREIKTRPN